MWLSNITFSLVLISIICKKVRVCKNLENWKKRECALVLNRVGFSFIKRYIVFLTHSSKNFSQKYQLWRKQKSDPANKGREIRELLPSNSGYSTKPIFVGYDAGYMLYFRIPLILSYLILCYSLNWEIGRKS